MKRLINNIRTHHWHLGENKNDFATTTGATFNYDKEKAGGARTNLNEALKNDLRATHYKLGYTPDNHQTTHQSAYVPFNNAKKVDILNPELRKSHFNLNQTNLGQDNKTIYMTDYTKKEILE
jgi:hypothetical protein